MRANKLFRTHLLSAALALFGSVAIHAPSAAQPSRAQLDAIIARVKEDLAKRQGVPLEAISTLSSAEVTWRDTSMGCGEPTKSYAKIDIEGYRIILAYEGQRFDYRAREDGHFALCTGAPNDRR